VIDQQIGLTQLQSGHAGVIAAVPVRRRQDDAFAQCERDRRPDRSAMMREGGCMPTKLGCNSNLEHQRTIDAEPPYSLLMQASRGTTLMSGALHMHTDGQPHLANNKLLAALPDPDRECLRGNLHLVELPFGKVVHEPGSARQNIYFPVSCVFSKQYTTAAGDAAEVASVGSEGLVGIPLLLGCTSTPIRTVVQIAGSAWCGDSDALRGTFVHSGALQNLILRFTQALMTQMGQNAVCYQHHSVEQQFCLWLLLTMDRAHSSHLHLTQDLIAQTLGIRRPSISAIVSRLAQRGIVRRVRGYIEILDRTRLESTCCECYGIINREYARLLP
jgi:CRP-like cAMP-binding protein